MSKEKDDITRYREGSMTGAERHAFEKKALNDPFLAEALEGAETIGEKDFTSDVNALSQKIRTGRKAWFTPLRVAAGVLLILTVGSLGYYLNPDEPLQIAKTEKNAPTSTDSLTAATKPDSTGAMIAVVKDATSEKAGETAQRSSPATAQPTTPATTTPATTEAQAERAPAGPAEAKADTRTEEAAKTEAERAEPVSALAEESPRAGAPAKEATGAGVKRAAVSEQRYSMKDAIPQRIIRGTVITEEEGTPLPGVNIAIKGTTKGTVTDLHGNYSLPLPSDPVTLSYSFIGMETKEVKPGNQTTLNVNMKADAVQLSEVMIVGQSQQPEDRDDFGFTKPVIRLAAPVGGIRAYNKYLENSLQYPPEALAKKVKGKVVITFTVTTTGSLTDFNIVRGLGYGCEDEVVRLVKEGPDWTPSFEDDTPVESEVRVKLKFDPEKANK